MDPVEYLHSLIKVLLRDKDKYLMARRAYVSNLRAYGQLRDKDIFKVKNLNLKLLSKSFGLSSVSAKSETTQNSYMEELKKTNFNKMREIKLQNSFAKKIIGTRRA